jgi:hypothetical protein
VSIRCIIISGSFIHSSQSIVIAVGNFMTSMPGFFMNIWWRRMGGERVSE